MNGIHLFSRVPRPVLAGVAVILSCAAAHATITTFTEANSTDVWTLPTGTNLLDGSTVADGAPVSSHGTETTGSSWSLLTNGSLGTPGSSAPAMLTAVAPNDNQTATFILNTTAAPLGYNLTSLDTYCAWGDSGRDNQTYKVEYATVANPTSWITIASVNYNDGATNSTHVKLTSTSGLLGVNAAKVRFTFGPGQENGYVGYREFIMLGTPTTITPVNESNSTNVWTLPAGTNLLATATPTNPSTPAGSNHGNGDFTSPTWSVLTDGTVGTNTNFLQTAAPANDTSVNYELDTSVNTKGYNITSVDTYAAWADSGRDNQDFTILYSTVTDPTTFIPLAVVANHTTSTILSTHSRVAPSSGYLAQKVKTLKFYFANQENGYVGYREFIALGTPVPLTDPITWTGLSGSSGNAAWVTTPDNNWKVTADNSVANFSSIAPVNFDSTGTNANITIPTALTAADITFANSNTLSYVFGGQQLTVTNALKSTGSGSATFNDMVLATGGLNVSGSGSLVFNGGLTSNGITVSGSGSVTLLLDSTITGGTSLSAGTLTVKTNAGLGFSPVTLTGGTVAFTSDSPAINSLAGTSGSIVLGNTALPADTTLYVGDATNSAFGGNISDASGSAIGGLYKVGSGTLLLSGTNTYTGFTTVQQGTLEFETRTAFYNANTAMWTADNVEVLAPAVLGFRVGDVGEFTMADLTALDPTMFDDGSFMGLNTGGADFTLSSALSGGFGVIKSGTHTLTVTAANTYTGPTRIFEGVVVADNTSGPAFTGNVVVGNDTVDTSLNMAAVNQFGPNSSLGTNSGSTGKNAKVNLRGFNQTVAGLDGPIGKNRGIIQNDETSEPGYTIDPGPVTLTINNSADHSFLGIIREQNGGTFSIVKNGAGTQEFINSPIQGYGFHGATTVNQGKVKLSFTGGNSYWTSPTTVNPGATLQLYGGTGAGTAFLFGPVLGGSGTIVKDGAAAVVLTNGANTFTNGITINSGILAINTGAVGGAGNAAGQFCGGGAMTPTNVITVNSGSVLSLDFIAPLGQSSVLPAFAPSVVVNEGGQLGGGTNTVAFVANVTLNGGLVEVHDGAPHGGFNTDLTLVGTVIVGGSSTTPSVIHTTGTGPYANISLGSSGLPGTVFQVADVTSSSAADLVCTTVFQDIQGAASPLTKTGPGTMSISGTMTYTGSTHVAAGELQLDTAYLADASAVVIDAGAKLTLTHTSADTISTLTLGGVQVAAGTYGSTTNTTPGIIQTPYIQGTGMLLVTNGPVTDPYVLWASQISDSAQRGRTADPDGDGFTNEQEYLFGTSPVAANGSLSRIVNTGSGLVLRWNQRTTGTSTYVLKESTTLASGSWTTSSITVTDASVQDVPDYTKKEAVVPVDSVRKFYRLEATE